jgi:hypothetical protein
MDKYLYAAVFFVFIGFVYWYSSNQSEAGYNECKADLADARAVLATAVAEVRAEEEQKLAEFRRQMETEKRKYKNELAKYKNKPDVAKWSNVTVPDVLSDNVWLRHDNNN